MVDPGDDFGRYMESLKAAEERAARYQRMYDEHEVRVDEMHKKWRQVWIRIAQMFKSLLIKIWRQTTWGGFFVRQLQAIARHFKPFFEQVSLMMQDEESLGTRIFIFAIRLLIIFIGLLFVYALGRLVTFLVGGDIIREDEVVIVHEYETEEEAAKAQAEESPAKEARGKRSKQRKKEE